MLHATQLVTRASGKGNVSDWSCRPTLHPRGLSTLADGHLKQVCGTSRDLRAGLAARQTSSDGAVEKLPRSGPSQRPRRHPDIPAHSPDCWNSGGPTCEVHRRTHATAAGVGGGPRDCITIPCPDAAKRTACAPQLVYRYAMSHSDLLAFVSVALRGACPPCTCTAPALGARIYGRMRPSPRAPTERKNASVSSQVEFIWARFSAAETPLGRFSCMRSATIIQIRSVSFDSVE